MNNEVFDPALGLEELQQIYAANACGLGVVDRSLRYRRLNERLAEMNGIPVDAHIGRTVREVLPDLADRIEPLLLQVIERGQPGTDLTIEAQTASRSGLNRTWNCHFMPVAGADPGAESPAVLMVVEELTSAVQYEKKMAEERQALVRLADAMPMIVLVLAHDLTFRFANARWHEYRTPPGDGTGPDGADEDGDFLSYVHPRDHELVSGLFNPTGGDSVHSRCEARLRNANGEYYWHLIESEHAGSMLGLTWEALVTCADISNQKLIQEKLRRRTRKLQKEDRRKDEFLGILGHELRNPLAAIRAAVGVLKSNEKDLDWATQVLDEQSTLVARLIDDLLDEARIRSGKINLQKSLIDLGAALELGVETVREAARAKQISLTVEPPPAGIGLRADPTRLQQIITNLLRNAVRYSGDGGRVTVGCAIRAEMATIYVRDQGRGISPDMLERIFEPFIQIDASGGYPKKGLGVGLSLVRTLVELHLGSVEARSEGEGRGSEFVVTLPGVEKLSAEAPNKQIVADERRGGSSQILVVDDNQPARVGLTRVLKMKGFQVQSADSGQQALGLIEAQEFDVCILDIGLPDVSGYELARAVRATAWGREAMLVALTGYGHKQSRADAREAGFDHHLLKPANLDQLMQWVNAHEPAESDSR